MLIAFALSIGALCSDPEDARLAMMSSPMPAPGQDKSATTLLADTPEAPPAKSADESGWDGDLVRSPHRQEVPDAEHLAGTELGSQASTDVLHDSQNPLAIPPSLVREASRPANVDLPWLVHSSTSSVAASRYEELPPPPDEPGAMADIAVPQPSPATAAEGIDAELQGLADEIGALRADLAALHSSRQTVEQSLAGMAASSPELQASLIQLQVWILATEEPAATQSGFLESMLVAREFSATRGLSRHRAMRFAWTNGESTEFWRWLHSSASLQEKSLRTFSVPPGGGLEIDVKLPPQPRIKHDRGVMIVGRGERPAWGERLGVECDLNPSGGIELRFCPAAMLHDNSAWTHAVLPPDAVLAIVMTADDQPSPAGTPGREVVVIMQPALSGAETTSPPLMELEEWLTP